MPVRSHLGTGTIFYWPRLTILRSYGPEGAIRLRTDEPLRFSLGFAYNLPL
jgi:hypothetical protein